MCDTIYLIHNIYGGEVMFNPRATLRLAVKACKEDASSNLSDYLIIEYELDTYGVYQPTHQFDAFGEEILDARD